MRNKRFFQGRKEVAISIRARAYIGVATALALFALIFFSSGCSKLFPTAPDIGENQVQGYRAEDLWPSPPANLVGWPEPCSAERSRKVGPKGGVLHVHAKCFDLDFKVPSGALSENVFISVKTNLFNYWRNEELQKGLHFDFGPDGLVFSKPAVIRLEAQVLEAENGEVLKFYSLNSETGLWYAEQEVVMNDATLELEFEVSHFSRYAISQ